MSPHHRPVFPSSRTSPDWIACYPTLPPSTFIAINNTSTSLPLQVVPPSPLQPSQTTQNTAAVNPGKFLAPHTPGYISLRRNYQLNKTVYPYLRNTHDPSLKFHQPQLNQRHQSDSDTMPYVTTWRADVSDTQPAHHVPQQPPVFTRPPTFAPSPTFSPPTVLTPAPAPPFEAITRNGSPFMVQHLCRSCHQPRSVRYHAEHQQGLASGQTELSLCRKCKKAARQQEAERITEIQSDHGPSYEMARRRVDNTAPRAEAPPPPPAPRLEKR